jgi:hypothetical protein
MRIALVKQWLRAAHDDPPRRKPALRYAAGAVAVQLRHTDKHRYTIVTYG